MPHVSATFESSDQLNAAITELRNLGYDETSMEATVANTGPPHYYPDGYDPLGGLRFSGQLMGTMPATGNNLVGNSVSIGVELNKLPDILESLANQGEEDNVLQADPDYLLTVETDDPDSLEPLLKQLGGETVEIYNTNI